MTPDTFARLALSLPDTTESAHLGKRDFRVHNKIFASLPSPATANLALTPDQQALVVELHGALFSPLQNAWGAKGWTALTLENCPDDIACAALEKACSAVAAKARRSRQQPAGFDLDQGSPRRHR
jgi:hypothetical protein